jgi:hypothetical protein
MRLAGHAALRWKPSGAHLTAARVYTLGERMARLERFAPAHARPGFFSPAGGETSLSVPKWLGVA